MAEIAAEREKARGLVDALTAVMRWLPVYPKAAEGIVGGHAAYDAAVESARSALAAYQKDTV